MCGIFGYFDQSQRPLSSEVLAHMGHAIAHRGPDDQGVHAGTHWAVGNQRLSIMDVAGGHQPFYSDDKAIVVVQNGEIFNHIELAQEVARRGNPCRTHCDTEVLLRLYELEGMNFLSRLNGMFAIAVYDAHQDALFLARDRIGVKPLFIHHDAGRLLFASEIKSLLKALPHRPAMNEAALAHYLAFNYVPPPMTLFSGVDHLAPGHVLKINRQGVRLARWWDLSHIEPVFHRSEADWADEFNALLEDAVRLRLRSDVPFGAFLSGGVDSSSVVGMMARHMNEPVKTFCIGFHDPRFDEAPFAQAAADRFGTEHVMQRVDEDMLDLWPMATYHCDQPHGDVSFLPTYRVSELAVQHVKVVLSGDGGDELFAGYDKYQQFFADMPAVNALDRPHFERRYFDSISLFTPKASEALYGPSLAKRIHDVRPIEWAQRHLNDVQHQDRINQALYLDMMLLLPGNNLVKPDRMAMAVSLEVRTPFLDYRMMEFAFRMPGHLKLKDGVTKYLYKKAVAPMIGNELAYRKKQMFTVPVGEWFKQQKKDYCAQHLARLDMFDPAVCATLLQDHVQGKANNTRELRALIAVSHWLDMP